MNDRLQPVLRRAVVATVLAFVITACLGDDPAPTPLPLPGGSDGGSGTDGGAGADDSGSPPDGGDAPPPPNRSVACEGVPACTGTDKCCGVGVDWIGASCKGNCGANYSLNCDDASDCRGGQICCYVTDGGARAVASFCAVVCRPEKNEKQLCSLSATDECRMGSCSPLTQFAPGGLARCN